MHGEFKVPGGELVVVDVDIHDGRIANVQLSGDFFDELAKGQQLVEEKFAIPEWLYRVP